MKALVVNNLSKKFKANDFYSLKKANLEVEEGDIVGLVGKNGAGKSTFLKLLAKSYIPTEGTVELYGQNIYERDYVLNDVGLMIEPVFYPQLTVIENLKFYLKVHNRTQFEKNIPEILRLVDLERKQNLYPDNFSFGMKQRLALAISIVDEPNFILLDEPFVGLDPYGVQELLTILKKWANERKVSMIISSHQIGELEQICNRFVLIDSGQMQEMNITNKDSVSRFFYGEKI